MACEKRSVDSALLNANLDLEQLSFGGHAYSRHGVESGTLSSIQTEMVYECVHTLSFAISWALMPYCGWPPL